MFKENKYRIKEKNESYIYILRTLLCGNGQKNEKINRANLAKYALDHIYRQTSECRD